MHDADKEKEENRPLGFGRFFMGIGWNSSCALEGIFLALEAFFGYCGYRIQGLSFRVLWVPSTLVDMFKHCLISPADALHARFPASQVENSCKAPVEPFFEAEAVGILA